MGLKIILRMHKFFENNKLKLAKKIDTVITGDMAKWAKINLWANNSLPLLAEFSKRGKLIRGLLVLLAAQEGTKTSPAALDIASCIEIMHSSILVHDDIMDRDLLRRGSPTLHAYFADRSVSKLGKESLHHGESLASCIAIIGYFIAMGRFSKIKDKDQKDLLINLYSEEMALLGMAQMSDVTLAEDDKASESDVLKVYEQKTGRYTFGLPLLSGFILAGKYSKRLHKQVLEMSIHLGIIFQLKDDMLGIFGDSNQTGKSVGGDIRERKKTLLYFELIKASTNLEKSKLLSLYNSGKPLSEINQKFVYSLFKKYDIEKKAEARLDFEYQKVNKFLPSLPFSKIGEEAFKDLVKYLLTRSK